MRVALLGLGLIGGSVARALRTAGGADWSVVAWTPAGTGPSLAAGEGIIDEAAMSLEAALGDADLVVLAAPPVECLALLRALAGPLGEHLADDAVITDVASTKGALVALADALGLRYVGGHPMAGRETSGFAAADEDLFRDRPWVVVPGTHADAAATGRVEALALACRARPVRLDAAAHDAAVAGISHAPLIIAAALVEAVAGRPEAPNPGWPAAEALAATGWASMTRLALGDPAMGAGIAATNAPAVAARLRDVRAVIDEWIVALGADGGPDQDALARRLAAARSRLGPADR